VKIVIDILKTRVYNKRDGKTNADLRRIRSIV